MSLENYERFYTLLEAICQSMCGGPSLQKTIATDDMLEVLADIAGEMSLTRDQGDILQWATIPPYLLSHDQYTEGRYANYNPEYRPNDASCVLWHLNPHATLAAKKERLPLFLEILANRIAPTNKSLSKLDPSKDSG